MDEYQDDSTILIPNECHSHSNEFFMDEYQAEAACKTFQYKDPFSVVMCSGPSLPNCDIQFWVSLFGNVTLNAPQPGM